MTRWQVFRQDPSAGQKLSQELKISPLTAQILINRGIDTQKKADEFLNPRLLNLKDPFDIPNILDAAKRVLAAKEKNEKILIYGDYDVDGVTGTVILIETFKFLGLDPGFYIPSRYGEGYSMNLEVIKKFKDEGIGLIVTVDCGISNLIEIEEANSVGIDVVVTDHHNLPQDLPAARAIVNPKMIKNEHPSKYLSGAGVAFKFAWALLRTAGIKENGFLTSLLDLVALGTVADVVPLTDENRILTVCGMKIINEKKRPGIKALADIASIKKRISIRDINFGMAPRINAAGRLEHASLSVKLLTSKDKEEAAQMAQEINKINQRRQGIGENMQEEVFKIMAEQKGQKILIASGNDWHPGVIGIIASRVVDAYYRPTVIIGINEGVGRGSARSIDDFSIFGILDTCRDLFNDFGGHEGAAGFEIDPEKIPELKTRLLEKIDALITEDTLTPKIVIDCEISPRQITLGQIKELEALDPFGQGNPSPVFMTKALTLSDLKKVGAGGSHLKIKMSDGQATLEVIGFRMGDVAARLSIGKSYDIAYNLEANEWNGFESAQLNLQDIKEAVK
ncbi:MAG: single-stranded-DNA-specific exonuclease RecJ [Candidatus Margulisiibacteriota bacterium]